MSPQNEGARPMTRA